MSEPEAYSDDGNPHLAASLKNFLQIASALNFNPAISFDDVGHRVTHDCGIDNFASFLREELYHVFIFGFKMKVPHKGLERWKAWQGLSKEGLS